MDYLSIFGGVEQYIQVMNIIEHLPLPQMKYYAIFGRVEWVWSGYEYH